jgi:hypothetical protein
MPSRPRSAFVASETLVAGTDLVCVGFGAERAVHGAGVEARLCTVFMRSFPCFTTLGAAMGILLRPIASRKAVMGISIALRPNGMFIHCLPLSPSAQQC